MDCSETRQVEQLIRYQAGKTALFEQYDRSRETPMNFVLDEAKRQLDTDFVVYWVEGGLPELYSVSGFSNPIVVYNTRYIELSKLIRQIIVAKEWLEPSLREELAERICLRVMAELALRQGDSDWAVRAFLRSIVGQGINIPDIPGDSLAQLEAEPFSEGYLAIWFFGLVHELGHLYSRPTVTTATDLFSDSAILSALETALEFFPYPDEIKQRAMAGAQNKDPKYVLSIENLRAEAQADTFAVFTLLCATFDISKKIGSQFRIDQFIAEMLIFLEVIAVLDRCKRVARIAKNPDAVDRFQREEFALHQLSYGVRGLIMREWLETATVSFLFNTREPDTDQLAKSGELVNETVSWLQEAFQELETGMERAVRFGLFPEQRATNLMTIFAEQLLFDVPARIVMTVMEAEKFCQLAESFGVESESTQALQRLIKADLHGSSKT